MTVGQMVAMTVESMGDSMVVMLVETTVVKLAESKVVTKVD